MSLEIHAVMFRPDDQLEITYQETRDRSDTVTVIRTVLIDSKTFRRAIAEIEENLVELVDAALLALRNPPDTEPLRRSS